MRRAEMVLTVLWALVLIGVVVALVSGELTNETGTDVEADGVRGCCSAFVVVLFVLVLATMHVRKGRGGGLMDDTHGSARQGMARPG